MKPLIEPRQIISSAKSTVFKLHNNATVMRHLTQLVVTNQYSNPQLASIREIVSNAYDANLEAQKQDGVERSVEITVAPDRVIVRDYGFGLSEDWMLDGYASIANSTKHDDQDLIGAKGIGRLAPLAVSKQYFVTSYHAGVKSLYCIFLNESSEISISLWDQVESDKPSGLEVTILCPNKKRDAESHTKQIVCDVYAVAEGTRHKVNLDLEACKLEEKPIWLSDYKLGYVTQDDFTVDLYSKPKLSCSRCYIYVDLGGAIYPAATRGYSESWDEHCKPEETGYIGKALAHNFDSLNNYNRPGAIIVRVSPDYLVLNTSREEILNTDEQNDKLNYLVERANEAVSELHAQYVQRAIQEEYDSVSTHGYTPYRRLYNLFLAAINANKELPRLVETSNETISVDLGDSWTASVDSDVFLNGEGYSVEVEGSNIKVSRKKIDFNNYYYLTARHGHLSLKTDEYKWGVYKITPKSDRRGRVTNLTPALLLKNQCYLVFYSGGYSLNISKLEKYFNADLKDKAIAVITSWTEDDLASISKMHPLIDVLGVYQPVEAEKLEKEPATRVMPEVSILMRQLKQSEFKRDKMTCTLETIKTITPEILNEKVIYFCDTWSSTGKLAANIPAKYLSNYSGLLAYVSENAYDRVTNLVKEGKCNWVAASTLDSELRTALYNDYGFLVNYVGFSSYGSSAAYTRRRIIDVIVNKGLGEYLPDLTRSLANCSQGLVAAFEVASNTEYNCKEITAKLFEPYIGEYKTTYQSMLGPLLSPYYDYFEYNYSRSGSQEQVFEAIAFKLKSEGATIYKNHERIL